ncbi:MAG: DUF424 domain-containing protein [Candidatus Bathyarchaeum sp.]|nr:MAG: DUF424 domain-containing protein [Candidatus Bathyarchaeum sp.]
MDVYAKLSKCGEHVLLAACDEELLGEILKDGKIVFKVGEEFYKGPKIPVDDAVELMEESTVVNMVGPNIVKKAIEKGLVHPDAVLNICGVPHAQIVKI